jgi:hypothetical protein
MREKRNAFMLLVGGLEGRLGCEDCIHLAQDRDQWWALVNAVMKLLIPTNDGEFFSG